MVDNIVPRNVYMEKIKRFMGQEEIKLITGVRRCGKTFLLRLIVRELKSRGVPEENIFLISLESTKYDEIHDNKDLNRLVFDLVDGVEGKVYLLFDEIQLVKNWEKSINGYRVDLDCDLYVTGSNSKLLSGDNIRLLGGRYIKIEMYPFSFNEILNYHKNIRNEEITSFEENRIYYDFLQYGGLPRLIQLDEEQEKQDYLLDIYNSIILDEIIPKNKVRDVDFLKRIMRYVIRHISRPFSATSLSKSMKHDQINIEPKTIKKYLRCIMESYILLEAVKEEIPSKKELTSKKKYYLVDQGFYELNTGTKKDLGSLIENVVFMELKRRGYQITVGIIKKLEVDFICRKGNQTKYFQISESIADEVTREREFRSLEKIKDNYPKYVITQDTWDYSQNGIQHVNIIDFLKNEDI